MSFLCSVAVVARAPHWLQSASLMREAGALPALCGALSPAVGEAVVRGTIIGLADTLPGAERIAESAERVVRRVVKRVSSYESLLATHYSLQRRRSLPPPSSSLLCFTLKDGAHQPA